MSVQARCSSRVALTLMICASMIALAGCSSVQGASDRIAGIVKPYRVDVVQGNFVSSEQVAALQPGMGRQQVREILGTPLVSSLFHADRWEYVFTLKRPGEPLQTRKLTVFFKGDLMDRAEGDDMPSETEFVASLGKRSGSVKVPALEATPEQLARFPAPDRSAAAPAALEPAPTSYPPLEAPMR